MSIPTQFLTGAAGTGKTWEIQRRISQDPNYGVLSATTGISAVNLGAITLNSLLGYFDTASLRDVYITGRLAMKIAKLSHDARWLIIDEVSMLDADQLDMIYLAATGAAMRADVTRAMGVLVTGDFCQLPPVNAKWAFEAQCWPEFQDNTTRLTTNWRQGDAKFLEALSLARQGKGPEAVEVLQALGVRFHKELDPNFDGTTIVGKNDAVERYNQVALLRVKGQWLIVKSERWGKQRSEWEWDQNRGVGIPPEMYLKMGVLVMILANDLGDGFDKFTFANGDLGHIEGIEAGTLLIRLLRNGELARVNKIERHVTQREPPEGAERPRGLEAQMGAEACAREHQRPYYSALQRGWVTGAIKYFPIRAAYASTTHKSQSLTLDRIQLDIRNAFVGHPGMAYVGLSRVRSATGLRLVGSAEMLAKRIRTAPEVMPWI